MRVKLGRLSWKLFLGNAALIAAVLFVSFWFIIGEFRRFHGRESVAHLRTVAGALTPLVEGRLNARQAPALDRLAKTSAKASANALRVTLVAPDGTVLGDSHADPAEMDSHADRPEIVQALAEGWGRSRRWSNTLHRDMQYVAIRLGPGDKPEGVVRVAMAVARMDARTASMRRVTWILAFMAIFTGVLLALGIAWLWSGRIERVTATARTLMRGDLSARVDESGSDELALLARALNRLRDRVAAQLETIDRHRRGLEALLGRLQEGVIVADAQGRIVMINAAARRLLNMAPSPTMAIAEREIVTVEQCVADHELQRLLLGDSVARGPRDAEPGGEEPLAELRAELPSPDGTVTVLARAMDISLPEGVRQSPARGTASTATGRLLVLTDITELMRAVKMKTDFVANASHELRTPLSAIRAAVETATGPSGDIDPAAAQRCMAVIARQAARLEQMVADLLDLSRVESAPGRFKPEPIHLPRFCDELFKRWRHALDTRKLRWSCALPAEGRTVSANAYLLQLILDNLIDNAIKFSDPGSEVRLTWHCEKVAVTFDVADDGCGISPNEQQRVFERFYQVSASRSGGTAGSGRTRGTGLGLAIVRHAVTAMHGTVKLESSPGAGTRVRVRIPQTESHPRHESTTP